jgi:hypothetical protein
MEKVVHFLVIHCILVGLYEGHKAVYLKQHYISNAA